MPSRARGTVRPNPNRTMKTIRSIHTIAAVFVLAAQTASAQSEIPPAADRCEAPHFEVAGEENAERFPLKSTAVHATLSGVIAAITVEQTYSNTGDKPIEAVYVFPASTRAAVHGVDMLVGERKLKAEIKEKEEARKTYEQAKSENKTASLLEQQRPNVFRMSVANILPGDVVRVTLRYSEKLTATDRNYEFIYPTVVGPRYTNKGAAAEEWVSNPYLGESVASPATFEARVDVRAGMPLQSLTCTTHDPKIEFTGKDTASVTLPACTDAADRDLVVRYRLAGDKVDSGMLLHRGKDENFFLLNVEPPARVTLDQIPARDYLFVLDVSGSMHGFPLNTAKGLMGDLLGGLRPTDTFNVLFFAGGNQVLANEPLPATPENITRCKEMVERADAGGGTELLPALRRALDMPMNEGTSRSIVVVTDGFVEIEREAFELVRSNLGRANLFAFGIGSSVNRWLVEGLARAGQGEPFFVLNPAESTQTASRFRDYISSPVLTDIKVRHEGFDAHDIQPRSVPDVFADRPIELIGKWRGKPSGRIVVTGRGGNGPFEAVFDVAAESHKGTVNPALAVLWAREKVRSLSDDSMVPNRRGSGDADELRQEITTLGLTYQLLTQHTSFVAVDNTPREVLAKLRTVNQPLPLPKGVSANALGGAHQMVSVSGGGAGGSAPEPGVFALLLLTSLSLLLHRHRQAA